MNLCELARRAGEPYRVSSQIGKLLMLWYSGTRRKRRRRRYYRQKRIDPKYKGKFEYEFCKKLDFVK